MTNKPLKTNLLNIDLILEKSKIKAGDQVGDLGCGRFGSFTFISAEKVGKKGVVYAVDIIKHNLETIAREAKELNLTQIKTVWSDIEVFKATKIEASDLNLVFLINMLYETKQPLEVLKEAKRLLKTNGRLVIVDWKKIASPIGPDIKTRLDKDKLIAAAKKLSLMTEEEFEAGKYHFGLVFVKA